MANAYNGNPIIIDTFGSDLDISNLAFGDSKVPFQISKLVFFDPTASDIIVLKDNNGAVKVKIQAKNTNQDEIRDYLSLLFSQGLKIVAADQTVTTGELHIYI